MHVCSWSASATERREPSLALMSQASAALWLPALARRPLAGGGGQDGIMYSSTTYADDCLSDRHSPAGLATAVFTSREGHIDKTGERLCTYTPAVKPYGSLRVYTFVICIPLRATHGIQIRQNAM
eukprot:4921260-Prymnesium_polylepis.2